MSKELHFNMRQLELAHILTEIEEGNQRALPIYADLNMLIKLMTEAKKQVEPYATNEAMDYAGNSFEENGIEFTKKNGSTSFNYKNISEWAQLEAKKKVIELKAKQAYLSIQKGIMVADENGEEITLPEVKYSKGSLIVKSKKS